MEKGWPLKMLMANRKWHAGHDVVAQTPHGRGFNTSLGYFKYASFTLCVKPTSHVFFDTLAAEPVTTTHRKTQKMAAARLQIYGTRTDLVSA